MSMYVLPTTTYYLLYAEPPIADHGDKENQLVLHSRNNRRGYFTHSRDNGSVCVC